MLSSVVGFKGFWLGIFIFLQQDFYALFSPLEGGLASPQKAGTFLETLEGLLQWKIAGFKCGDGFFQRGQAGLEIFRFPCGGFAVAGDFAHVVQACVK